MPTPPPADTLLRQRLADLIRPAVAEWGGQSEFAKRAGVRQSVVSSILSGARADLRAETVTRITRALGLSATRLGQLLHETHPEKSPE